MELNTHPIHYSPATPIKKKSSQKGMQTQTVALFLFPFLALLPTAGRMGTLSHAAHSTSCSPALSQAPPRDKHLPEPAVWLGPSDAHWEMPVPDQKLATLSKTQKKALGRSLQKPPAGSSEARAAFEETPPSHSSQAWDVLRLPP